jgi:O-antigen ligase
MSGGSLTGTGDGAPVLAVPAVSYRAIAARGATVAVPFVVVLGLALANGGSEPTHWGWATLVLLWIGITAVVAGRLTLSYADLVFVGGFVALLAYMALGLLWTDDTSRTLDELFRVAVYPAAALATIAVGSRVALPRMVAGVFAAGTVTCCYALLTRLVPDRFGSFDSSIRGYRLTDPFPYWNMLGGLAALTIVTAVGLAVHARPAWVRCVAAATLPPLALTLYFTFSRGAIAALAIAIVLLVALDPARRRVLGYILMLLVPAAVAVQIASRRDGLTLLDADLALATRDGHEIGLVTVALAAVSALLVLAPRALAGRLPTDGRLRVAWIAVLAAAVVNVAVAVTLPFGGPVQAAADVWDSLDRGPARAGVVSDRLFSTSSNGREALWSVAIDGWRDAPVLGQGAGTFEAAFMAEPDREFDTANAHSLYVETLMELGVVGLLLLGVVIAVPFAAFRAARREPLAAAALCGFAAVCAQAAVDTNWESPALMVAAIFLAGAVIAAGRGQRLPVGPVVRGAFVAGAVTLAVLAGVGLYAFRAIDDAVAAFEAQPCQAVADAERATTVLGVSARTWTARAAALTNVGDLVGARAAYARAIDASPTDFRLWFLAAGVADEAALPAALDRIRALNPRLGADPGITRIDPADIPPVVC